MAGVYVKGHRRGASVVKAYTRSAFGKISNEKRGQRASMLRKKIAIGDILFNRKTDPGVVMARMRLKEGARRGIPGYGSKPRRSRRLELMAAHRERQFKL